MKAVLSLVLMSAPVVAAEPNWQHCRAIADDTSRLTCYDALVQTETTSSATAADTATPIANADKTLKAPDATEFGLEHKVLEAKVEQITSRIPGTFRGWEAKTKITLENGQVWQVADGSHGYYQLQDPVVTIERGLFGSFLLKIEGANRSPKVKRLK